MDNYDLYKKLRRKSVIYEILNDIDNYNKTQQEINLVYESLPSNNKINFSKSLTMEDNIIKDLSASIKAEFIEQWMNTPNKIFGGMTPYELIDSGKIYLLQDAAYHINYGIPG